ncbi:MAG: peptidase E [Oscillospiraceae bacterium]|nr:peptidase E [Oscillospiraceae bacterium]
MQTHNNWCNVLLTDSGFYYDSELDKPLDLLINSFKAMLQKPLAETTVLFIPTAAMHADLNAKNIANRLKNELMTIGILSDNITVHDIDGSLSEEEAMKFDVIYFTGGKTPYLAQRVFETGFDKIIKKMIFANKVYIGVSAGSMLLMSNFNVDDPNNPKFNGLGLIEAYFTAHCGDNTQIRTDLPLPHIALRENQALKLSWTGYELLDGNLQYLG